MSQTQELATRPIDTIAEMLEEKRVSIGQLLPAHVDINRFIKSALLAVSRNPQLMKCTKQSIITSIINAAELGLDFTPAKGHAYIVTFGNEATFMPGYRGFIDLARRSGVVRNIEAHVVYENDEFDYQLGSEPKLFHRPTLKKDKGKPIGAYAIAFMPGDFHQAEFMDIESLNGIKARSKSKVNGKPIGPWLTDESEMQRKTVVRRLFKYLPCSPDLEKAIEADNKVTGIDIIDDSDSRSRTEQLADLISPKAEDAEFQEVKTEKEGELPL